MRPRYVFAAPALALLLAGIALTGVLGRDAAATAHALFPEAITAICGVLFLAGLAQSLHGGLRRKCPACGAWWSRVVERHGTGSTSRDASHFTADGWSAGRRVTSHWHESLECRTCRHAFSRQFSSSRRVAGRR